MKETEDALRSNEPNSASGLPYTAYVTLHSDIEDLRTSVSSSLNWGDTTYFTRF